MRICAANIFERLQGFLNLVHFRGSQLKFPCEAHNGKHDQQLCKAMFAIVGFTWELELTPTEMDQIQETLKSFKYVRCTYTHFAHPGHHFLHSLRILGLLHEKLLFLFGFMFVNLG